MQSAYHNVPRINGQMQRNGKKYKAYDVKSSAGNLSLDIAGCYPADAGVKTWKRTYRLDGKSLKITDRFEVADPVKPDEVVFMVWGPVENVAPGVLRLSSGNVRADLRYSDAGFDVKVEEIALDDPKLVNVWGSSIHRIVLTSKLLKKKDTYKFEIIKR
jgi:hypothetical protein